VSEKEGRETGEREEREERERRERRESARARARERDGREMNMLKWALFLILTQKSALFLILPHCHVLQSRCRYTHT
jgi:hypothetical protein